MTSVGEASGPRLSKLGRYELITRIGEGGMAEVQLALQRGPAGFEKLVVVKLVHEKLATEKTFVDMLLDEARVAAMVKHPNVVDIYDLGQAEGRYFIAMEYLEGEPLLSVLRKGREGKRLDPLSTGRLISDTAEGLDAAHELRTLAGDPIELVHHDVSLGNIVVLYNGQVKLVDFGVAKASQSAGPRVKVQGKFSYMAPEKMKGAPGDRRSDIFSLGVVAWEAMTLRRLFKGGNDTETMRQVLDNPIPRPSEVNPDVPKDFDPIIMKAVARDPAGRYATAKELAHDLEEVLREHKYGGKNEIIARYMQATFASHILARKKLLQEVSSKGRASADILEAAFDDSLLASGSPTTASGDFSVKFSRPSGQFAVATPPPALDEGNRPRSEHSQSQVLQPLRRPPRPSGQLLSQPYEPDAPMPGGGTTTTARKRPSLAVLIGVAVAVIALVVVLVVVLGGGDEASTPAPRTGGAAASGAPAGSANATTGSATGAAAGSGAAGSGGSAASAGSAAGSADTTAAGSAEAGSADATAAGSADAGSAGSADAGSADAGSAAADTGSAAAGSAAAGSGTASAHTPTPAPTPARPRPPSAQELFKTGMQAYVQGDSRAAIMSFRRAVQSQPGYATAWRALGIAHEKLGEKGQAKTALQRYLQLAPNAADADQIRERITNL